MTEDKCSECNTPIPDGGTWGYCNDCWDDDLMKDHDKTEMENN